MSYFEENGETLIELVLSICLMFFTVVALSPSLALWLDGQYAIMMRNLELPR